ncbi:calcineurin regulatory subunit B [Pelomyxa schiedti]|nr:calcineurin regulatory subunit B [Pelomyxa schiedti]
MGLEESALQAEEVEEILSSCPQYSTKEIRRLYKRFCRIDREHRGTVNPSDLMHIPEFAMNPLCSRLVALFPAKDGFVNFKQFAETLAVFHPNTRAEEKLKLMFTIYDEDGDGFISRKDLITVLLMVTGKHLGTERLNSIADEYLRGCEKMSFDQFKDGFTDARAVQDALTIRFIVD